MTSLERTLASAGGNEPDRVPVCPLICGAAHRVYGVNFDEFSKDGEIAGKCLVEAVRLFGYDVVVFLHTGGQAALFPYRMPLKAYSLGNPIPWTVPPWSPLAS